MSADAAPTPSHAANTPRRAGSKVLTRVVGTTGLLAVALILTTTVFIAWNERERLYADAAVQVDGTASFLADHAGRLFEVADVALISTTAAIGDLSWDEVAASRPLQASLQVVAHSLPYIEDVWLNDASGLLRATSLAFPAPYSNAADRFAFRAVQQPGRSLVIGDLIVGRVTKRATFLVARRLDGPAGALRGMVSGTADLAYFDDYWRGLRLPYNARIRLVRAGTAETLANFPKGTARAMDPAVAAALSARDPPQTLSVLTPLRIASYHRVGSLPLYVGVSFDPAAVDEVWRQRLRTPLPFAVVALLAMAALTLVAFRQSRRETRAAAEVEQARAELARVNAGLEDMVAERTAELRETSEEVQRFAYLMSHDLRAPLVNVLGFTGEIEALAREAMADDPPPGAARRAELARDISESVGFVRAGASKMNRLLNHMLRLSREGRRTFHVEPVDVTALVRSLADTVRFQAASADAVIEVCALPTLLSDRLALEQIFGNLLDNAVKYLEPARPGRIQVTGRMDGRRAVFEVGDNGRGIEPRDHERVFELFRRAGPQDRDGEGIGLAYVRTLVRLLGGRIDLRSELGKGTTMVVTLPIRSSVAHTTGAGAPGEPVSSGTSR